MSVTSYSEQEVTVFLTAYKQFVYKRLYDELMTDIQPRVQRAANEAVKDLEAKIQTYVDCMNSELLVRLTVSGLD